MLRSITTACLCASLAFITLSGCSSSRGKVEDYRVTIRIEKNGAPVGSATVAGTITEDGQARQVSGTGSPISFPLRAALIGADLITTVPDAEITATLIAPDIRPLAKKRFSGSEGAKIVAIHQRGEITESLEIDVIPQGTVSAAAQPADPVPAPKPDRFHHADGTTTESPTQR